MSDDLITSLRALAAAQHSDLTVAADAADRIERLREALTEISQYETSAPAGFEWDIVVEELVEIARKALEAKP